MPGGDAEPGHGATDHPAADKSNRCHTRPELSGGPDHSVTRGPRRRRPGQAPAGRQARCLGGMSASTSALDPAARVVVFSLRSRSRPSVSLSPERQGGLQPRALLHLRQVHDRVNEAGAASRRDMPRCGAQRRLRGALALGRDGHVGSGHGLVAVLDLHTVMDVRIGHRNASWELAVAVPARCNSTVAAASLVYLPCPAPVASNRRTPPHWPAPSHPSGPAADARHIRRDRPGAHRAGDHYVA